ncbi:hypothetical protein GCM10023205_10090 [Yinghuangia aomiensis]|uniref:Uncharacterized protein n=1 Tax=Yinghuangia aomiensis TaxID=676205 RepID=A0ABP9GR67_9ACTN
MRRRGWIARLGVSRLRDGGGGGGGATDADSRQWWEEGGPLKKRRRRQPATGLTANHPPGANPNTTP